VIGLDPAHLAAQVPGLDLDCRASISFALGMAIDLWRDYRLQTLLTWFIQYQLAIDAYIHQSLALAAWP
jgi:hypothetical protein